MCECLIHCRADAQWRVGKGLACCQISAYPASRTFAPGGWTAKVARSSGAIPSLPPTILVDDLGQRAAPHRPEFPQRVADGNDGIGMNAGRQAERCFGLLLVEEMARRERGTEAERARRKQHVLHGRINAGGGPAVDRLRAVFATGNDPNRRLVEMRGEILHSGGLPPIALGIHSRRQLARSVMRPDHLVEGALIPDLHGLLDGPVLDDEEAPLLRIRAVGRALPGLEDAVDERIRYGVRLEAPHGPRRMDDVEKLSAVGHQYRPFPIIFARRVVAMIAPSGLASASPASASDAKTSHSTAYVLPRLNRRGVPDDQSRESRGFPAA